MHGKHLIKLLGLSVLAIVGVMAMSASAAQAKYLLLLNHKHVTILVLELRGLKGHLKAENGLEIECQKGTGEATVEEKEEGAKLTGSASGTLEECVWVGAEETCIINDGGEGLIHAKGTGSVARIGETKNYKITAESKEFATIFTEGPFCTISEEEVVSGTGAAVVENAEEDAVEHTAELENVSLKLGNSNVTGLSGKVHILDLFNLSATIGIDWVP